MIGPLKPWCIIIIIHIAYTLYIHKLMCVLGVQRVNMKTMTKSCFLSMAESIQLAYAHHVHRHTHKHKQTRRNKLFSMDAVCSVFICTVHRQFTRVCVWVWIRFAFIHCSVVCVLHVVTILFYRFVDDNFMRFSWDMLFSLCPYWFYFSGVVFGGTHFFALLLSRWVWQASSMHTKSVSDQLWFKIWNLYM